MLKFLDLSFYNANIGNMPDRYAVSAVTSASRK